VHYPCCGTAAQVCSCLERVYPRHKCPCVFWMPASSPTSHFQGELSSDLIWSDRINFDAVWFDLVLASCYPNLVVASPW
jgi:hypothetical protein